MLVASPTPSGASPTNAGISRLVVSGVTSVIPLQVTGLGYPGGTPVGGQDGIILSYYISQTDYNLSARSRWRASKGSAPTNRFRRSIGNNGTERWHRTMPVATYTIVTVPVPAVFLRDLAVQPSVLPGQKVIATPPTTIRLVAVAPAVSASVSVAVPPSRITLNAVAPARSTTVSVATPAVAVRDIALAPAVVPGSCTVAAPSVSLRLLAVAPQVQNFILVPAANLRLLAVAPAVSGGGGGGGTVTLRKSGD